MMELSNFQSDYFQKLRRPHQPIMSEKYYLVHMSLPPPLGFCQLILQTREVL